MAKGLEDTALYRYNRLVALNDVGDSTQIASPISALLPFHDSQHGAAYSHTTRAGDSGLHA